MDWILRGYSIKVIENYYVEYKDEIIIIGEILNYLNFDWCENCFKYFNVVFRLILIVFLFFIFKKSINWDSWKFVSK